MAFSDGKGSGRERDHLPKGAIIDGILDVGRVVLTRFKWVDRRAHRSPIRDAAYGKQPRHLPVRVRARIPVG